MNYKNYICKLSGVFKVENDRKLHSLEIYQGEKQIFKTDYIYEDEKSAFKDAKEMINKNRFDTEIIRESINEENLKNDIVYRSTKRKKISNSIIISSIILMIISYIVTLTEIRNIGNEFSMFIGLYAGLGVLFSIIMLYWEILSNGGFELNNNQRKVYSAMWWINLLFNKGPVISYNEQPFKDKEKGWYSSTTLIALAFEALFGIFIIVGCIEFASYSILFYGTIISYILLIINYIFSIVWEVSDAKIKGKDFPFKRIISPILVIIAMVVFACFYIKIVGIY